MKIAHYLTLATSLAIHTFAFGQEEIRMDFIPEKLTAVTSEDYTKGRYMLQNTYQTIREDGGKLTYTDYWNVAFSYAHMGVNKETIFGLLQRFKAIDSKSFCEYVNFQIRKDKDIRKTKFYELLGEKYTHFVSDCEGIEINRRSLAEIMKEKEGLDLTGLNESLIDQLINMLYKDQYYRREVGYTDGQKKLDEEVQIELVKIFDKYGYPGQSLVGEKYRNYACFLLEHGGTMENYEKYFPLVAGALTNGELDKPPVRMLIDRIHWRKTGKQIFGSHAGKPFDTEDVIAGYKKKYNL